MGGAFCFYGSALLRRLFFAGLAGKNARMTRFFRAVTT
jgi:hypothetical protein